MSVIPQTPRAYGGGGFVPLDPLLGLCPGPAGDLKRSLGTLRGPQIPLLLTPPPNPKSWIAPDNLDQTTNPRVITYNKQKIHV
jgi:hypothetical protein